VVRKRKIPAVPTLTPQPAVKRPPLAEGNLSDLPAPATKPWRLIKIEGLQPDLRKEELPGTSHTWELIKIEVERSDRRTTQKQSKKIQVRPETSNAEVQTDLVVLFPLPPPNISPFSSSDSAPDVSKPPLTPVSRKKFKKVRKTRASL